MTRGGNQPAMKSHAITAFEPNILITETKVCGSLLNALIWEENLAFNKPVPAAANNTQNQYPQKQGRDFQEPENGLSHCHARL